MVIVGIPAATELTRAYHPQGTTRAEALEECLRVVHPGVLERLRGDLRAHFQLPDGGGSNDELGGPRRPYVAIHDSGQWQESEGETGNVRRLCFPLGA